MQCTIATICLSFFPTVETKRRCRSVDIIFKAVTDVLTPGEGGAVGTDRWMDVSKSDDSHGERAFPSTGSKKEAVIELLVDCCLVTAGDGRREGQERERQLLPAPILIPFFEEKSLFKHNHRKIFSSS